MPLNKRNQPHHTQPNTEMNEILFANIYHATQNTYAREFSIDIWTSSFDGVYVFTRTLHLEQHKVNFSAEFY